MVTLLLFLSLRASLMLSIWRILHSRWVRHIEISALTYILVEYLRVRSSSPKDIT